MIADLIRDVGIAAFFITLVVSAWYTRRHPGYIRATHDTMPPAAQLAPVPVPLALPSRTPVAWQLPMEEELELISPQLRKAVHRMLILLLVQHANQWSDEVVRELETAQRQIVRGEVA